MKITKQSVIGDILDYDRTTVKLFVEMGMECLGCPNARSESVEEACEVHEIDCDEFVCRLNEHIK
ncbi:MAG: DUF1858 domain-containing protein [Oscillospiraceae bacterium]|nr:DUF1858 domain-containing protein [Oscillospiraceae bacterium]